MSTFLDELGIHEKRKRSSYALSSKHLLIIGLTLAFGIYIGSILYGQNNIIDLLSLQEYKGLLSQKVEQLNHENAVLQKKVFESKLIEGVE
jgi:hypothetical protein